jgi:hypothetical protein
VNVASPYDRLRDKMRSFPSNEELRHLLDWEWVFRSLMIWVHLGCNGVLQ